MSVYSQLDVRIDNKVATVEVRNAPANAITSVMLRELTQCFEELEARADVKSIIVTGNGKFFVAGADIKAFVPLIGNADAGERLAIAGQTAMDRIARFPKPVIAAINGICLGGGLELAMSCHLRVASLDAVMGLPELKLGLIPGFGGTQRLARLLPKAIALELIVTGRSIGGQEAERLGLVNAAVPAEELMPRARRLAELFAQERSAGSISAAIEAVTRGTERSLEEGLALEAKLFGQLFATADMKEGVSAFLEKRTARFEDR